MSRSWHSLLPAFFAPRADVWLAPTHVRVVSDQLKPRGRARGAIEAAVRPAAGGPSWQGGIGMLGELLANGALAGARANVTLSNHFVRYVVVPWSDAIVDDAERHAAANGMFKLIYGDAADNWSITAYDQGVGRPMVAAAIDRDLVQALRGVFGMNAIRLAGLQPCLAYSFNLKRERINQRDAWFAVAERDHVCIGYLRQGAWNLIRSRRATGSLAGQLVPMLEQARVAEGVQRPSGKVFLYAPGRQPLTLPKRILWNIVNLHAPAARAAKGA